MVVICVLPLGFVLIIFVLIGIETTAAASFRRPFVVEMQATTSSSPKNKTQSGIIGAFMFPHGAITVRY